MLRTKGDFKMKQKAFFINFFWKVKIQLQEESIKENYDLRLFNFIKQYDKTQKAYLAMNRLVFLLPVDLEGKAARHSYL